MKDKDYIEISLTILSESERLLVRLPVLCRGSRLRAINEWGSADHDAVNHRVFLAFGDLDFNGF